MTRLKAQSAVEYLMIIGITLGIILPTTYLFFRYSSQSNEQIIDSQINQLGKNIIDTAQIVYFSGKDSKIVLELNVPKSIENVKILEKRELVFTRLSEIGENEMVFFSSGDIKIKPGTGLLEYIASPGLKKIRIQAVDDGSGLEVLIEKT